MSNVTTPTTNIVPSSPQPQQQALPQSNDDTAQRKTLKPKRSAIFYPSSASQSNQKPFSSSAAKRESVLALGSIAGLQHLYSKQGIASKSRPGAATLAIGLAGEDFLDSPPDSPTLSSNPEAALAALEGKARDGTRDRGPRGSLTGSGVLEHSADVDLPPSPKLGTYARPPYPHFEKPVEADHQAQRPLVLHSLETTCQHWGLLDLAKGSQPGYERQSGSGLLSSRRSSSTYSDTSTSATSGPTSSDSIDLVELMASTTRTIRSVRTYLLALPADAIAHGQRSDSSGTPTKRTTPVRALGEPKPKDVYKRQSMFNSLPRGVIAPSESGSSSTLSIAGGSLERTNSWNRRGSGASSSASVSPRASIMQRQGSSGPTPSAIFEQPGEDSPITPPNKPVSLPAAGANPSPAAFPSSTSTSANKPEPELDALALVRRSALDVLGMLREVEEKYRLPPDDPAYTMTVASSADNSRRTSTSELGGSAVGGDAQRNSLGLGLSLETSIAPSPSASANSLDTVTTKLSSVSLPSSASTAPSSADAGSEAGGSDTQSSQGYLYRADLRLSDLPDERHVVRTYVETVDHILSLLDIDSDGSLLLSRRRVSSGTPSRLLGAGGPRLAGHAARSASSGSFTEELQEPVAASAKRISKTYPPCACEDMREVEEPEEEEDARTPVTLPAWADEQHEGGDDARIGALLEACLPPEMLEQLIASASSSDASASADDEHLASPKISSVESLERHQLLAALSDGEALCVAYNAVLRRSSRPWGIIPSRDIHTLSLVNNLASSAPQTEDYGASTAPKKTPASWTFRRTENLRVWAAALRLRYSIAPGGGRHGTAFDARVVARKEEGWEVMLGELIRRWVDAVGAEAREGAR